MGYKEKFMQEYYSTWDLSEDYKEAYRLLIKYEYECERFDRFICTGEVDDYGFIKPINYHQSRLINDHAQKQRKLMSDEFKRLGIKSNEVKMAREAVSRLSWSGIEKEYERIYMIKL